MLTPQPDFARLINQIRNHDQDAFAELMRRYEPEVCRLTDAKLRRTRLGRLVDAADVWQAVLLRMFSHAGDGQLDLDDPERLLHLLHKMAANELRDQARWGKRVRRDLGREPAGDRTLKAVADPHATPARLAEDRDLIDVALHLMHHSERELAVGWAAGKQWDELAREAGGTAESVRKQFARAMARVASLMGGGL